MFEGVVSQKRCPESQEVVRVVFVGARVSATGDEGVRLGDKVGATSLPVEHHARLLEESNVGV